jgi:hypothetical protein
MSDRAEGPTFWGPIIREGRPAIPFLIGQFSAGETAEDLALNRRLDSALRLTLEWLHSRQPFTTTPLPPGSLFGSPPASGWRAPATARTPLASYDALVEPQQAGRERWAHWWKENEANVPDLGRADDLYNAWRDNYHNSSPSLP